MARLRPIGLFMTAVVATALLSAPTVLADGGHHDQHRGSDGAEHHVVVVNGTPVVVHQDQDNDEVQAAPAQPVQVVEVEPEVNDIDDDND